MFKWYRINIFLIRFFLFFVIVFGRRVVLFSSGFFIVRDYFLFDFITLYLILLVVFLGVYAHLFFSRLGWKVWFYIFCSLGFSLLCFSINHAILFWCFYELSMLPLLYLIFKESPYSERFLAGWYFSCYLLVTSLPLILILLYLSIVKESCFFSDWVVGGGYMWYIYIVLSFVFFTKIPLVPFHTWLPIVHAEATRLVSICLSGYIMKLGLLGVYRCTYFIFDHSFINYLFICLIASLVFFIVSSSELDGKRWLAFLRLSHIVIAFFGFFIGDIGRLEVSFFYCLGHGLRAGIVFGLLWFFYDVSNTRKWLLLKHSIGGVGIMLLVIVCLLRLCSFPTTIQFFCEVNLIKSSGKLLFFIVFWIFYLLLGGVIPLILCGYLLIRSEWIEVYDCCLFNFFKFLLFLRFWCYIGFIII